MASHVIDSAYFSDLYGTPAMRAVWSDHNLLQKWLDFEAALARAEVPAGIVPPEAAAEITRTSTRRRCSASSSIDYLPKSSRPIRVSAST
jgi:3-carboxy-cis,cis-muconate cycloisomerase